MNGFLKFMIIYSYVIFFWDNNKYIIINKFFDIKVFVR